MSSAGASPQADALSAMGADEFLPIHMFVLVQSRLENPLLLRALLYQMCDESSLQVRFVSLLVSELVS